MTDSTKKPQKKTKGKSETLFGISRVGNRKLKVKNGMKKKKGINPSNVVIAEDDTQYLE